MLIRANYAIISSELVCSLIPFCESRDILDQMIGYGVSQDPVVTKDKQGFWKRVPIIDDDDDIITTFQEGIEAA